MKHEFKYRELIEVLYCGTWIKAHYIGLSACGDFPILASGVRDPEIRPYMIARKIEPKIKLREGDPVLVWDNYQSGGTQRKQFGYFKRFEHGLKLVYVNIEGINGIFASFTFHNWSPIKGFPYEMED